VADPIVPERAVRLSPLVRRITQNNPGAMTGPGTNTYLVGVRELLVIDPGQDTGEHFRALVQAIADTKVHAIAVTHAHPDHWPLAPRLASALRAQTLGLRPQNGFEPDRQVAEGAVFGGSGWSIEAIHTPGHCGDHLCYLLREEDALFTGDHVMGWSTSVIMRPDGSLHDYLQSLEKIASKKTAILYPGHGEPVLDPQARIAQLIAHRHERTAQIRDAIASGARTVDAIVERVYPDLDPALRKFARSSVEAHLEEITTR
jgi:glyoxylase-like metal-dependent hydrolase (beta-lactamase superfamily II)